MEDLTYIAAMAAVVIAGFLIIKRVASCLWNTVVAIIVLTVLVWGLRSLGVI